jgi:hypothetical protein
MVRIISVDVEKFAVIFQMGTNPPKLAVIKNMFLLFY